MLIVWMILSTGGNGSLFVLLLCEESTGKTSPEASGILLTMHLNKLIFSTSFPENRQLCCRDPIVVTAPQSKHCSGVHFPAYRFVTGLLCSAPLFFLIILYIPLPIASIPSKQYILIIWWNIISWLLHKFWLPVLFHDTKSVQSYMLQLWLVVLLFLVVQKTANTFRLGWLLLWKLGLLLWYMEIKSITNVSVTS